MSGEPRCKKCGKLKLDHNRGFYGRWFCDDEETLFEPAEPSPAPPVERVIEVAPHPQKPWWDHWRPESDYPQDAPKRESSSSTAAKIRELESALTTMREERDRARDALRAIRLRVNRQFAVKTIDEYFALKPVSDRQSEAIVMFEKRGWSHLFQPRAAQPVGTAKPESEKAGEL